MVAGRRSEKVHKNLSKAGKNLALHLIAMKITLSLDLLRDVKLTDMFIRPSYGHVFRI